MKATGTISGNELPAFVRFGLVSAYDEKKHMARIEFPDRDSVISGWLPVAARNTKSNHDENPLDVGGHVACLMQGNGTESGIVLCGIYDETNTPPGASKDIRRTEYEDGTVIEYDRKNHKLSVNVQGEINIQASGNITIRGAMIYLN